MREELIEALVQDPQEDLFEFRLDSLHTLSVVDTRGAVWRARLDARLDGRTFEHIAVDIVGGEADLIHTELLRLPGMLRFADLEPVEIEAVDRLQHFAEKLHALTRTYGDRPSSRVKDLADMVLLIDDGLPPTSALRGTVTEVFAARPGGALPDELADPPAGWDARYLDLVEDLDLSARTVEAAMATLHAFWATTLSATEEQ